MLQTQVAAQTLWWAFRESWPDRQRCNDDGGMTTETVIITAVLAALAVAVGAIIYAKVFNKANSIDVGS